MSKTRPKVFAVVPAAGAGTRMGGGIRKQFLPLKGKPIVVHALQQFEHCPDVDEIAVAVPESALVEMEALVSKYRLHKVSKVIVGGVHRQDSVFNALSRLAPRGTDVVLVHDGVRPFVEPKRISHLIRMVKEYDAAVLAVQPKDTIRRSRGGVYFDETLDRSALWLIQTPQGFRASLLQKAFDKARHDRFYATDEAALVEKVGVRARIVEGTYDNIKITTEEDVELGLRILERWEASGTMD
jgi:2-C-methyl-D-erythritol 4-phosphate cytidylyltransferase